jgi:cysteine desulfurase
MADSTLMRTYLDHNATSPLKPAARHAMAAALDRPGNASSIHAEGRKARALIDAAREGIARSLGVLPAMVVFTSGGTEANNLAIHGVPVERLAVSAVEHPSVIEAAKARGLPIEIIPVDASGVVKLDELRAILKRSPLPTLVSVMLANNETGVIQPVRAIVEIARSANALVHTDAVQAFGKMPVNFGLLGCDLMTISAHKLGGPMGIGGLVIRDGLSLEVQMNGGGQELRRRAGTENMPAIAGFAAAIDSAPVDHATLRDSLEEALRALSPDVVIFGKDVERIANTSCFAFPGFSADMALISLDLEGVSVSSGSACSSGKVARSHVLASMGVPPELSTGAIRVSLGWNSTAEDIADFTDAWGRILDRNRARLVRAGRDPAISGKQQERYPDQVRA